MSTKKLASGRNHAKIREVKARQALDLLNALNGNIVARVNSTEMILPATTEEHSGRNVFLRRATITRLIPQKGVLTDMLGALVVIMRLQAIFRGRRQRRQDKFTEELENFRKQRELMRTMIVMQRIARSTDDAKPKVNSNIYRAKANSSRLQERPEEPKMPPQSPSKPPTLSIPRLSPQPLVLPLPTQPPTRVQRRRTSAMRIQKVFRQHQERRQTQLSPRVSTPAKYIDEKLAKETASVVKMQSFVRGNLVRKRLQKALLMPKGPRVICLRIASSGVSNQNNHESSCPAKLRSQTCVYAMPERPSNPRQLHQRARVFHDDDCDTLNEYQTAPAQLQSTIRNGVAVEARRLVANHKADESKRVTKSPSRRSKPHWDRFVSAVVWETAPFLGYALPPPGVEFVKHRRPHADSTAAGQQTIKPISPRAASMTPVPESSKDGKAGVRLPTLASRMPCETAPNSLLCCLLPSQTKRLTGGFAPLVVRPIAQVSRQAFRARRRTQASLAKAAASNATA
ncbi:unnamed protein product [Phytophthora fragariaefolia]|uniref:Unnamed protein product n=1 Tax=Phytophthora fragariaefolia TaxID=1490495 RepID=A0A9W6XJ59_9STRA|nr:unnamed protein product [Phytophthora fragariaefolia]